MYEIKKDDMVINQDGVIGYVRLAGPYGDQPFQILSHGRQYHNFINADGTSAVNLDLWLEVQTVEDLKAKHALTFDKVFKQVRYFIKTGLHL